MAITLLPSPSRRRSTSPPQSMAHIKLSRRVVIVICLACTTGVLFLASISHPASRRAVWTPTTKGRGSDTTAGTTSVDDVLLSHDQSSESTGSWRFGDPVGWIGDKLKSSDQQAPTPPPQQVSYREHLEATTSPPGYKHSRTLTFSHIYVLSLQSRQDRRLRMKQLARALDIEITFIDAIVKSEGVVRWIGERVEEIRKRKAIVLGKLLGKKASEIGGLRPGCRWLTRSDGQGTKSMTFPSLKEERWGGLDWVQYLQQHGPEGLDAKDGVLFDATKRLNDPLERITNRQLNEGSLAVWYGQTNVMRQMIANGDESALVLEDDVDFEWDLERLWASIHNRLPTTDSRTKKPDWSISFLGHCWGRESLSQLFHPPLFVPSCPTCTKLFHLEPQFKHPLLHESSEPRCLHAYAITSKGATRILQLLSDPWLAYQTAVDIAIPTFVMEGLFGHWGAFSVDPQLIVQAKELQSDIAPGIGSPWRGQLMDSTWDRVLRDQGNPPLEPVFFAGKKSDPAIHYRGALISHPEVDAETDFLLDVEEASKLQLRDISSSDNEEEQVGEQVVEKRNRRKSRNSKFKHTP